MPNHVKQLNTKKNSYNQSFQYRKDLEKTVEGDKINPKKIFDESSKKPIKKKRVQKKKY